MAEADDHLGYSSIKLVNQFLWSFALCYALAMNKGHQKQVAPGYQGQQCITILPVVHISSLAVTHLSLQKP